MEEGLGYERYAVQGGDWGANIAARMAFDSPATVAAVHVQVNPDKLDRVTRQWAAGERGAPLVDDW